MWLIYATLASAFWGLSYTLNEQMYKYASIYTTIAINTFFIALMFGVAAWYKGLLASDLSSITASSRTIILFASGTAIFALAELFIALSIFSKNATLAGLIEITYPLFIALFAYLLFRENELNMGTALGGILIFTGVAIVYWFSK
jgi:drug/metabolite transporter (DMT)-like permease